MLPGIMQAIKEEQRRKYVERKVQQRFARRNAEQVAFHEEQSKMRDVKQRPNWSHNH